MEYVYEWWESGVGVASFLSATPQFWWYNALPLMATFVAVNLFFSNFLSLLWLGTKLCIAWIIYSHIKEIITGSVGDDPFSFESSLFNIPPGTIKMSASIGLHIIKKRMLLFVAGACPGCLPVTPPEPTADHWSDAYGLGFVGWCRKWVS